MRMPFSPSHHGPVALVAFTLVLLARRADGSESSTASLETVAPSLLDKASIVLTPNWRRGPQPSALLSHWRRKADGDVVASRSTAGDRCPTK